MPNVKSMSPIVYLLTPDNLKMLNWMPKSCAYRLIHENKDLPDWHPLVTGNLDSTRLGWSFSGNQVVTELSVDEEDLPDHITNW